MREIVGILLAAGAGARFAGNKLLHPLPSGEPIGLAAARSLVMAVPRSIAVIRAGDPHLAQRLRALGLRVVENPEADRGMGRSLAVGVAASAGAAGWLIALADMPWVRPQTMISLADILCSGASIVAPVHRGRRGNPVGFDQKWRNRLLALTGDRGARALLARHGSELTLAPTCDPGVLLDIDRRSDLAAHLLRKL